jgi:Zn finger protein HypA/HybF involved in hydrogenase expression
MQTLDRMGAAHNYLARAVRPRVESVSIRICQHSAVASSVLLIELKVEQVGKVACTARFHTLIRRPSSVCNHYIPVSD